MIDTDGYRPNVGIIICNKNGQVLWVPVLGERSIPLKQRIVGSAFLWTASPEQEALLAADWNETMEKIALGQIESISARDGQVMQIRPKAAHSKSLTKDKNQLGENKLTLPRGFYLRPSFTHTIISTNSN